MWNVHSRGRERSLSWLLARCSLTCHDFRKRIEKIVLKKKESMRSAGWLASGWPNRLVGGHWFARENRSVTATSTYESTLNCSISYIPLGTIKINKFFKFFFALSAGAVEYTNCFSAKGKTPSTSILDMTLNNLMVRFQ